MFGFKKYNFKPSYDSKNIKIYKEITDKYEYIFLKTINKEKLSLDETKLLPLGIQDIKTYIVNGLIFKMKEDFNSKTSLEKKLETLFYKAEREFDNLFEEIEEVAYDSIYEAMGYDLNKVAFMKESTTSYFLKYVQTIFFFRTMNHLEKLLIVPIDDTFEEDSTFVDELLINSKLKESLPSDIYEDLRDSLIKKECPKHLKPYFLYLESLKTS